jgi:hypothetical protein
MELDVNLTQINVNLSAAGVPIHVSSGFPINVHTGGGSTVTIRIPSTYNVAAKVKTVSYDVVQSAGVHVSLKMQGSSAKNNPAGKKTVMQGYTLITFDDVGTTNYKFTGEVINTDTLPPNITPAIPDYNTATTNSIYVYTEQGELRYAINPF